MLKQAEIVIFSTQLAFHFYNSLAITSLTSSPFRGIVCVTGGDTNGKVHIGRNYVRRQVWN